MTVGRPAALLVVTLAALASGATSLRSQDPRLQGVGFEKGDPRAPITVVEFGDFGCGACAQFATETWPAIEAEFVRTGQVRWKFVPFILGPFRNSRPATAAALCAAEQHAFWPVHDRLYQEQQGWSATRNPGPLLRELALRSGMDSAQFDRCYQSKETAGQIRELTKLARQLSVNATPTFLVGERRVRGALPLELFRQVLLEAAQP